jgi:putative transcriptional regulator
MPIIVNLDIMLAKRKMRLGELSARAGISVPNLSILKNGHARAIRFSSLAAMCRVLECQPGALLSYESDDGKHFESDPPPEPADDLGLLIPHGS